MQQSDLDMSRPKTHGMTGTRTYVSWKNMIARCYQYKKPDYHLWGGLGIRVCDKWRVFSGFLEDMGTMPDGMQLDRRDNNGDYCKENCRWVTRIEQCNNRRSNMPIEFRGRVLTLAEWCRERGLRYDKIRLRITRRGWSAHRALTTP